MKQREFQVILSSSPWYGRIGTLEGEIDYNGARNGWHTIIIDGHSLLFAGEELQEI